MCDWMIHGSHCLGLVLGFRYGTDPMGSSYNKYLGFFFGFFNLFLKKISNLIIPLDLKKLPLSKKQYSLLTVRLFGTQIKRKDKIGYMSISLSWHG